MNNHFGGVEPQERYNNDVLNELRKTNELLAKLIEHNSKMPETKAPPKSTGRGANKNANHSIFKNVR